MGGGRGQPRRRAGSAPAAGTRAEGTACERKAHECTPRTGPCSEPPPPRAPAGRRCDRAASRAAWRGQQPSGEAGSPGPEHSRRARSARPRETRFRPASGPLRVPVPAVSPVFETPATLFLPLQKDGTVQQVSPALDGSSREGRETDPTRGGGNSPADVCGMMALVTPLFTLGRASNYAVALFLHPNPRGQLDFVP